MGTRSEDGMKRNINSVIVLDGATALGATDTAIILWPNIAIDGVVATTSAVYTATSTAAAGTIITLNQPGRYLVEGYYGLVGAGILNGGISVGGTIATFNQAPSTFTSATSGFVAIGGNLTLATAHVLISLSTMVVLTRAQINGVANRVRYAATLGVTLNAANSLARIRYLGGYDGY